MRRTTTCCTAMACAALALSAHSPALASNAWLSLNLEFNDPTDFGSGGTWTMVGKVDERGLAGLSTYLNAASVNFDAATGFIAPAEFDARETLVSLPDREIVVGFGFNLINPTLDIGVIGGTWASSYVDDPNLALYAGNPDLGSFTGGVALLTGTFDAGAVPAWGASDTLANLLTGPTSPGNVIGADNVLTTVRYVAVPEPTAVALGTLALAGAALVAVRAKA